MVIVRGGGSRGDLAAFDAEIIARAIATCPIPVWTGIGHTGDQSVADMVANRTLRTPTECGQELVRVVSEWWSGIESGAQLICWRSTQVVEDLLSVDSRVRNRLAIAAATQLSRHRDRLSMSSHRLASRSSAAAEYAKKDLTARASRIFPLVKLMLDQQAERSNTWRRLLDAYDIQRQLERGYTITLDPEGSILRSAIGLGPQSVLVTRFSDGQIESVTRRSELSDIFELSRAPGKKEPNSHGKG